MRRNPPRRHLGAFAAAAAAAVFLPLPATMASSSPAPAGLPAVDFGRMGSVGLGGDFAGLDWHSAQSPFASSSNDNSTATTAAFSHNGDTLILRNADASVTVLGTTNDGGRISALCILDGTLYIGGEFSSLASTTSSPNFAAYAIDQAKFVALGNGLSGAVETVFCDVSHKEVWAGGAFNAPTTTAANGTTAGNVARWSTESSSFTAIPFGGLNGRVEAILASSTGESLYFGGEFTTIFDDNRNNSAFRSLASLPNAPPNTATTGNSGYLTPFTIPAAASQYGGLRVVAGPSSSDDQHNDSDHLLCPGSSTWFARDQSRATVQVLSNSFMSVVGVRIANGRADGRSVTAFTLTTLPDNTVRKLQYTTNGENQVCNPHCGLSTNENVWAQDFLFEDGLISITGLQISIEDWGGDGAALDYVQLLSDGAYASYVQSNNEGVCGQSNSSISAVGNWTNMTSPSSIPGTEIGYMASTIPVNNVQDNSLTLYPYVGSAGYYNISLVIPGCANIGDCASRTTVDVTVFPLTGSQPWTSTIDQRVQDDTTVLLYSGLVDATSPQFNPTIIIALAANPQQVSSDQYVIVASGVQMTLTGLSDGTQSPFSPSASSQAPSGSNSRTLPPGPSRSDRGSSVSEGPSTAPLPTTTSPLEVSSGSPMTGSTGNPASSGSPTLTSSSSSSSSSASPTPTAPSRRTAFGVFEWSRSNTTVIDAATAVLANSTETIVTELGFSLDIARNASATKDFQISCLANAGDALYVGGKFALANSYSNVISTSPSGGANALGDGGLNGLVKAAAVAGNDVYFGGEFTGTAQGSNQLNYLAKWDSTTKAWSGVAGGVDGPVEALSTEGDNLLVSGNFTNVLTANGTATSTGGYAIYNTVSNEWSTFGLLYGAGSASVPGTNGTYIGGRFLGSSRNAVNGIASLVMDQDGTATIQTLAGVVFSNNGSASSTSAPSRRSASFLYNFRRALQLAPRADLAPLPSATVQEAPATLAGTYWTNNTADGNPRVTIIGGNFTSGDSISGVAFQTDDGGMTGPSPPVTGVVRALYVFDDTLYVGGSDLNIPSVGSGIVTYDLEKGAWVAAVPLSGNGGQVTVNAIRRQGNSDVIVAAGNFVSTNNGSFSCPAVCLWSKNGDNWRWSQPGLNATISSGEVRAIDFGDEQEGTLVAGGSFVLGGKNVYAAKYNFASNNWAPLDGLPGPVLSLAINDRNMSNIFAAGVDGTTAQPYLQRWDGNAWSAQHSDALSPGTVIQQLAFVPLKKEHEANGVIEPNRILMASGDINLPTGNVSSALYDGDQWYPYLVGSTTQGTLGSVSSLFWSDQHFSFNITKYLARGLVVLVAIAIATGLILLLILLILLSAYCLRRHERKQQPTAHHYDDKDGSDVGSTRNLIHDHVQTALEKSLMRPQGDAGLAGVGVGAVGAAAGAATLGAAQHHRDSGESQFDDADADDEYVSNAAAAATYDDLSDEGRETMMRYDFFGPELQAGELPMRAGQRVIVLDDEQSDEWWYCRDPETGREGVVPSTYVL